jgi:predicted ArsR family transcriptional regulator
MITSPMISALIGDRARATLVSALLDGRPLTASELAAGARITPQTASAHLAKLTAAGVLWSAAWRAGDPAAQCSSVLAMMTSSPQQGPT